jgi:hypothetical protein
MAVFIGSTKRVFIVYFLHKRNEEIEYEEVIANNEKEAIKLATKKHRLTYPKVQFSLFKVK